MLNNKKTHYGLIHVFIHWIMAGAILFLFSSGLYMVTLDYYDLGYTTWPRWHKEVGVIVLCLLIFRIFWLIIQIKPHPLASHRRWEILLAHSIHGLMYLFIALIVSTGYLIATSRGSQIDFFGLFNIPAIVNADNYVVLLGKIHLYAAWSLMLLIALHMLGAIKHAIIDRDGTLKRIIGINPEKVE